MVREAEKGALAVVTRHEKPVAVLLSAERFQGLWETMELRANPKFMRLAQADRAGRVKYKPLTVLRD